VLELGGSDPFIVLADADLGRAVETGVKSRMLNSGQSCIAAKRFIVEASIADRFEEAFVTRVKKLVTGNPMQRDTDAGRWRPRLGSRRCRLQVSSSLEQGAPASPAAAGLRPASSSAHGASADPGCRASRKEIARPPVRR
jgi:succinate-semialdehyde dehydrogenase/glutarate-semialdehyde dehydrogenase